NHPSIALSCGANETHPKAELVGYLRSIVALEDHNDRMYKSSSNHDVLSSSVLLGNQQPKLHFENSGSNLALNNTTYSYASDRGYGLRTEIGTATFPNYESVKELCRPSHCGLCLQTSNWKRMMTMCGTSIISEKRHLTQARLIINER